ncbi:hypothetical protein ACE2AJ_14820 [Aquihabitans daechungensis]|uniref:hypothetical protein n=1 Tax=Aquihabitans daechungensis TaxID=1052257 RepID=UPI003BA1FB40
MTLALVTLAVAALVVVAVKASEHLRHAENIDTTGNARAASSDDLSSGSDRPAGPDAEDPATVLPNRADVPRPTGGT